MTTMTTFPAHTQHVPASPGEDHSWQVLDAPVELLEAWLTDAYKAVCVGSADPFCEFDAALLMVAWNCAARDAEWLSRLLSGV